MMSRNQLYFNFGRYYCVYVVALWQELEAEQKKMLFTASNTPLNGPFNILCDILCVPACFLQVASESEHCIIKREHEKCMERIMSHNPSDDLELGK